MSKEKKAAPEAERETKAPDPAEDGAQDAQECVSEDGAAVQTEIDDLQKQLEAAKKFVAAFAQMELEVDTPDFADALGELANMIAGNAKKDLGCKASISTPSVIVGTGHHIARLSDVPTLIVPCRTPVGDFAVEVSIKHVNKQAAAA